MSRGPGEVMRRAREVLGSAAVPLTSQDIARQVFGLEKLEDVTASQSSSLRRALRALAKSGEIEDMGRDWARKRRKWARPEVAQAHKAWARAFLEASQARAQAREEARRAARQEGPAQ